MSAGRAIMLFVCGQISLAAAAGAAWVVLSRQPAAAAPMHVNLYVQAAPAPTASWQDVLGGSLSPTPRQPLRTLARANAEKPDANRLVRNVLDTMLLNSAEADAAHAANESELVPPVRLNLAERLRERTESLGLTDQDAAWAWLDDKAADSEALQPLWAQLQTLRQNRSLEEIVADPELLEPLTIMLDQVSGLSAAFQGGGGGAGMSENLAPLLDALAIVEELMARTEDGGFWNADGGGLLSGGDGTGWTERRWGALLLLLLLRNNDVLGGVDDALYAEVK